jgi:hypothetical protein
MRTWALVLLVALAFGCRAAYVIPIRMEQVQNPNRLGAEVEMAAVSLVQYGVLGNCYHDPTGPTAHVSPLWPLMIAPIIAAFGPYSLTSLLLESFLAIALTTANLACLPWLARRAGLSEIAGWIAAFALAVLPIYFYFESFGDFEQPLATLVLLGLVACFLELRQARWQNPRFVAATGLLGGVAALLSPSLVPAIALMMLVELTWPCAPRRRVACGVAAIAGISLLMVAPWMVRNYYALGGFVPLRSNFGLELAFGNNPESTGSSNHDWSDPELSNKLVHPHPNVRECQKLNELGELAYMRQRQEEAVSWIRDHPGRFLALTAARFRMFWFPGPEMFNNRSLSTVVKIVCLSGITLLMFVGLARRIVAGERSAMLLAAAIVGPSLIYMITHVDTRYRLPVNALATLVAVDTVVWLALCCGRGWGRRAARSLESAEAAEPATTT